MLELNREFQMEENLHSKDVRNHHRICEVQKHLLQKTDKLMEYPIWYETSIEWAS